MPAKQEMGVEDIRAGLFKRHKFKSKNITLWGNVVEVRQPSVGDLLGLQESDDRKTMLIQLLVQYCFVPGTDKRIFDKADEAAIMEWPIGQWFTDLSDAVSELTGVQVEEAEGN